jgi:hypothetical protein
MIQCRGLGWGAAGREGDRPIEIAARRFTRLRIPVDFFWGGVNDDDADSTPVADAADAPHLASLTPSSSLSSSNYSCCLSLSSNTHSQIY